MAPHSRSLAVSGLFPTMATVGLRPARTVVAAVAAASLKPHFLAFVLRMRIQSNLLLHLSPESGVSMSPVLQVRKQSWSDGLETSVQSGLRLWPVLRTVWKTAVY